MKEVLNSWHPPVILRSFCAFSTVPRVILRVTSTTRFFFVCLITVAIHKSGHTSKHALPLPAVFFTFSRACTQDALRVRIASICANSECLHGLAAGTNLLE